MLTIGCHLSAAKGYLHMGEEALSIGANTFQFFSRNPRGGKVKQFDAADAAALQALLAENEFGPLLSHAPYTLNPCSADPRVCEFARLVMKEDLATLEKLPGHYYNFHPGSHVGQGVEKGIEMIAELLNEMLRPEQTTLVLLETMSGKGSEVGSTFEEVRAIIDRTEQSDKLGVCLDTCHIYSAGYDIVDDLDGVLAEFDKVLGLERLKAVHLNDSMTPKGSKKDRHACIGQGTLGLDAIANFINHPKLRQLPFYLETPNELPGYATEIKLLKSLYR